MPKSYFMRQCLLEEAAGWDIHAPVVRMMAWLPEKRAKAGEPVRIADKTYWIREVYEGRLPVEYVADHERTDGLFGSLG